MRWSPLISLAVLLSVLLINARALPISPCSFTDLVARGGSRGKGSPKPAPVAPSPAPKPPPPVKPASRDKIADSSKNVRKASESHPYEYRKGPTDDSILRVASVDQSAEGKQADHILEVQLVTKHFAKNGVDYNTQVSPELKAFIKQTINAAPNVTPIDGDINSRKGSFFRMGTQEEKSRVKDPKTLSYIQLSFGTAKKIAGTLDMRYEQDPTLKGLMKTKNDAAAKGAQVAEGPVVEPWMTLKDFLIKSATFASGEPYSEQPWKDDIQTSSSETGSPPRKKIKG